MKKQLTPSPADCTGRAEHPPASDTGAGWGSGAVCCMAPWPLSFLTLGGLTQRTFSVIFVLRVPSRVPASLCGSKQLFAAVALKPELISLYLLAEFMSDTNQDSATQRSSSSRFRFFVLWTLYNGLTRTSFPDWGDAIHHTHSSAGIKNGFIKISLCFLTFYLLLFRKRGNPHFIHCLEGIKLFI